LENSNANLLYPAKTAARGERKQIFGMKSQATIFDPALRWQDGQFSFHLSLDKPKRPALPGR
jgi:hypothetical protein